jgi:hypothetical protein
MSANPTISPVFRGDSPDRSSPCEVTIENTMSSVPNADWVATHQLIKYLPVWLIVITPVAEL